MHIADKSKLMPQDAVKLRVCYVMSSFPVLSETFVSNEIRAMRALGHTVLPIAIAPYDGPCQPEDEIFRSTTVQLADIPAGAAVKAVLAGRGLRRALAFARAQKSLPLRSLMLAGARVAAAAKAAGCTHIHAHFAHSSAATAIVAARLAGMTVSFMAHGCDIYGTAVDLEAKLAEADAALATCDDMRADFLALCPTANARIVRCGIDPARFARREDARPRNGRILAVGRLVEQKGYEVLIDALALMPAHRRAIVDVVGTGERRAALQARAAAAGVSDFITFLGAKPNAWIAEHGPAYLGFVAPYVICEDGDRDTGPMVVKEAMAMELPVVASWLMGMKETVTPESGRHVPQRDPLALAEALDWLVRMPEQERRARGRAGRAHIARNFTLQGEAEALTAVIRGLGR